MDDYSSDMITRSLFMVCGGAGAEDEDQREAQEAARAGAQHGQGT
jgi:hypothetical protein